MKRTICTPNFMFFDDCTTMRKIRPIWGHSWVECSKPRTGFGLAQVPGRQAGRDLLLNQEGRAPACPQLPALSCWHPPPGSLGWHYSLLAACLGQAARRRHLVLQARQTPGACSLDLLLCPPQKEPQLSNIQPGPSLPKD